MPESRQLEPLRTSGEPSATSHWNAQTAVMSAARGELPEELLEQSVKRLQSIYLLSALCFAASLALTFGWQAANSEAAARSFALELSALIASLGAFLVNAFGKLRPQHARDVGYTFLLVLCLLLSFLRYREGSMPAEVFAHVSPAVIPIVGFAALIPAAPATALKISIAAAAMDPVALIMRWNMGSHPSAGAIALSLISPFFAAFIAIHISRTIHRLSEGIKQARQVGSYELTQRLGVGGMAEVWRGEHRMLARPAAVKLIRPEVLLGHGPVAAERLVNLFLREARTTAQMSCPNTIHIYDFGITREGAFYYVMELLDGVDLQALVERYGPQSAERTAYLLQQICRSLAEAHDHEFVHRDVKPANVFTCRYGGEVDFAKVLDFGLVLDRHPTQEEISDEHKFVGTPAIMAPEMLRFQAPVDARADLYAVGCVGYWLLVGQRVFGAETRQDMLVMHAHQKPVTPSKRLGKAVHPGLEAVIMACLEKNPDKRPQTARQLHQMLSELSFETPWTRERAEAWWQELPASAPRSPLPAPVATHVPSVA